MKKALLTIVMLVVVMAIGISADNPRSLAAFPHGSGSKSPLTFDAIATTDTTVAGGTSLSITNMTIGASANMLVAILAGGNAAAATMSGLSCTWNGVAMTLVSGATNYPSGAGDPGTMVLTLVNPATGNHTLACSWTTTEQIYASAVSFNGAVGVANGATASGSTGAVTLNVSSAPNDYVVCSYANYNASWGSPSGNQIYVDTSLSGPNGAGSYANSNPVTCNVPGASATAPWSVSGVDIQGTNPVGPASITSVNLSSNQYTSPAAPATVIGTLSTTLSSGSFSGTYALSASGGGCNSTNGANNGSFQISGNSLEVLSDPGVGTWKVCVAASGSYSNSPFGTGFAITGSSCPFAPAGYNDGCAGAAIASVPLVGVLNGYVTRPPWNVAGIDYGVGVTTGTTLTDATTATLPGGCSYASFVVTCASGTPTLNALDFSGHNGISLNITGGNVTVTNSLFVVGSNQASGGTGSGTVLTASGSGTLTLLNNKFDGNNIPHTTQGNNATLYIHNSGATTIEYNWLPNDSGDAIDFNNGTRANDIIRYNVIQNFGCCVIHSDSIQYSGTTVNASDEGFNTVYVNITQSGIGDGILLAGDGPSQAHNFSLHNSTLIGVAPGGVCAANSINFVGGYATNTAGDTNGRFTNNYYDPTSANCFTGIWMFPTGHYSFFFAQPTAVTGNVDMTSGVVQTAYPSTGTYVVVPDGASYTPPLSDIWTTPTASPSSGNITTGNTVTITLNMDEAWTVAGGTPSLSLNAGSGTAAVYTSGSGTSTLVFTYTAGASDATSNLAVTAVNLNGGTIKDSDGNPVNLSTAVMTFTGISVNSGTPGLTFTGLTAALVSSTTPGSGSYTVAAPSGLTAAFNSPCSGSSTVTGFSASGGNWNATFSTPASPNTCTITATGTGSNTASATSPSTVFSSAGGTCPQGTSFADGCGGAQATGSVTRPTLFTSYTGTNFSANRPPWNVPSVDYPVGYAGTLLDPTVGSNLPSCATKTGSGSGPYSITVGTSGCTLDHLDFSLYGGMCIHVTASGTTTFTNDHFSVGANCNPNGSGMISINTTGTVIFKYSQIDGSTTFSNNQGLIQNNTSGSTIQIYYTAFPRISQSALQLQQSSTVTALYDYVENIGCCGAHGDYVIGNAGSGTTSQDMEWSVIFAAIGTATTDCYISNQNNSGGSISSATCSNNVMLGATNSQNGYLVNLQSSGTVHTVNVNNNYMGQLLDFGFFDTTSGGGTISGPVTCTGNINMLNGSNATGSLSGTTCN